VPRDPTAIQKQEVEPLIKAGTDLGSDTGTVNYENGGATTGASPNASSQILYTDSSPIHYDTRTGTAMGRV